MLFFPLGRCGQGGGQIGPSAPFLPMALVIFLLLAFPSAGVFGQEEDQQQQEDEGKKSTVPNNGGGGEGGGEGTKLTPRHELYRDQIGANAGELKNAKANYVCLSFDNEGKVVKGPDKSLPNFREFCGCVPKNAGNENWKPKNFHYPSVDLNTGCMEAFYKVAMMPMCGNEWFDQMKLCALTQFFDDDPDTKKKIKEDANKKTLLLIDGCAVCSEGGKIQRIKVTHVEEEAGGMFSNCKDKKELTDLDVDNLQIQLPAKMELNEGTGSFSVPVILQHRRCAELFGYADLSDEFKNIKLEITHNCGGEDGKKTTIALPDVSRTGDDAFKEFQVAELRGLFVNLDEGSQKQYKPVSGGVEDKMPKYEAKDGDGLGWQNANVQCWFGEGTQCTLAD